VERASYQTETLQKPRADEVVVAVGGSQRPAVTSRVSALAVEVRWPTQSSPGTPLSYELFVSNPGAASLAGVRIEEQLSATVKLRSAEPIPNVQGERVVWDLGTIEGHGQRRIRVEIQPGGPADWQPAPTATFTAALALPTQTARPAFVVTQTAPDTAQRGSAVTIQIQVANHGPTPLTGVVVSDELPAGLQHPEGRDIEAGLGTLAPGETRTLRLDVVATRSGRMVNELKAVADGGHHAESRTTVQVTDAASAAR
jgi:uncharacterized repeat protein (TIGR01451 family)